MSSTEICRLDRFLQMEREFSSPRALMGKVTLVGTVSEYMPFIFSKRLLARVGPRRYVRYVLGPCLPFKFHSCAFTLSFLVNGMMAAQFEQHHCAFRMVELATRCTV